MQARSQGNPCKFPLFLLQARYSDDCKLHQDGIRPRLFQTLVRAQSSHIQSGERKLWQVHHSHFSCHSEMTYPLTEFLSKLSRRYSIFPLVLASNQEETPLLLFQFLTAPAIRIRAISFAVASQISPAAFSVSEMASLDIGKAIDV